MAHTKTRAKDVRFHLNGSQGSKISVLCRDGGRLGRCPLKELREAGICGSQTKGKGELGKGRQISLERVES